MMRFLLRLAIVVLLVVAISGLQIARGKRNIALVFVVDRSESVAPLEKSGALESMNEIVSSLSPEDEIGVVVFGKEAVIEQRLQKRKPVSEIQSTPAAAGTNISKGLNLAQAMLAARPESSKRIILISDGLQTSGDAIKEAAVLSMEGIAIDALPISTAAEAGGRKLFLDECSGPDSVRLDAPFDIRIGLHGERGTTINLQLFRDSVIISSRKQKLSGELEVFEMSDRIQTPGFHQYRVKIQDAGESRAYNNDDDGFIVYAHGRTRLLHVSNKPPAFLDQILEKQGFEVSRLDPLSAPKSMHDFAPYDVVLLDNAPAADFSEDQMRALAEHVEKYAGGLIMVGGTGSFGPGGYAGTPVEKILPVEMALKNREKKPGLALVLVLDKSGSMGLEQRKISKLDMAKDAVLRLTDLLAQGDDFGIIAFDKSPKEIMPLSNNLDRASVNSSLRKISAGGGTSFLPAVEMAYGWLNSSSAEKKHILLLSDGQADQSERKPLTERVAGSPVVLSTVGIGADVDRALLQRLADSAHGRAYFSDTAMDLPEIFKREGMLISGKWIVERRFKPRKIADHEITQNIAGDEWPEITGYIAVTPKKLSETLIASDNQDPILACWRYGLGKALVFTSDFSSSWTKLLVQWQRFPAVWTQMVRWCSRGVQSETMHPKIRIEDDTAIVNIDSFDASGNYINFAELSARVESPDSQNSEIRMLQTASGLYEGRFPLKEKGSYLLTVASKRGSTEEEILHFGFDFSKLPENREPTANQIFMQKLAETAHGRVLSQSSKPQFDNGSPAQRDLWQIAAILALLLFLVDLLIRQKPARF
jgi:Ca-activated chloride channel homolog